MRLVRGGRLFTRAPTAQHGPEPSLKLPLRHPRFHLSTIHLSASVTRDITSLPDPTDYEIHYPFRCTRRPRSLLGRRLSGTLPQWFIHVASPRGCEALRRYGICLSSINAPRPTQLVVLVCLTLRTATDNLLAPWKQLHSRGCSLACYCCDAQDAFAREGRRAA